MSEKVVWSDEEHHSNKGTSLFDIFSEHYALNEIKICFKNNEEFLLRKYNVIGWNMEDDGAFKVYDDPSIDKEIYSFDFHMVDKLIIN